MPYIKQKDREQWTVFIDRFISILSNEDFDDFYDKKQLLFTFIYSCAQEMMVKLGDVKYKNYERIFGSLCCIRAEFERRIKISDSLSVHINIVVCNNLIELLVNDIIKHMIEIDTDFNNHGGNFNYLVTSIIVKILNNKILHVFDILYVLSSVIKMEYNKEVAVYEKKKIQENGDVYNIESIS